MLIYYIILSVIAIIFGIIMLRKMVEPIIEIPVSFYFFVSIVMIIPFARLFLICFFIEDYFKSR